MSIPKDMIGASKWYAIVNFNDSGKIVRFNDWFNVDGLQVQINQ